MRKTIQGNANNSCQSSEAAQEVSLGLKNGGKGFWWFPRSLMLSHTELDVCVLLFNVTQEKGFSY